VSLGDLGERQAAVAAQRKERDERNLFAGAVVDDVLSYGGPGRQSTAERWFPFEPSIQRDQELARDLSSGFCELYESQVDCDVRCNPEPGSRSIG
jgi:hypothetical protein